MRLLALDSSLDLASAALWEDGAVLAEAERPGGRGQPAALPALAAAVLPTAAPDAVVAVIGPGGFTGLRGALALARGLALGWGVPIWGVTLGEALAEALAGSPSARGRAAWCLVPAGAGLLALERPGRPLWVGSEEALPAPEGPVLLLGEAGPPAAERLRARGADAVAAGAVRPRARWAAAAAARRAALGLPAREAAPLYARPPAVTRPPGGGS